MMDPILWVGKNKKMGFQSRNNRKGYQKNSKKKIKLVASGRTDKGVHAKAQHANFIVNLKIENKQKFLNSLNFF